MIPITRGSGDAGALDAAIAELRAGSCIGVFPEGTRSLGRTLRPRSGLGRLLAAVPEAVVVPVAVTGTTDITAFPKRPRLHVRFLPPAEGLREGESPSDYAARVTAEIRAIAPISIAGRKRRQIRALAKASLWEIPGLAPILRGMGQIPIQRGAADAGALDGADAVLVTHEHADHLHPDHLRGSDAPVFTIGAVARALREQAPEVAERVTVVRPGDRLEVAGFSVEVVGEQHAVIHPDYDRLDNSGYLVESGGRSVYHPGDALTVPPRPVDVLLAPVSAP